MVYKLTYINENGDRIEFKGAGNEFIAPLSAPIIVEGGYRLINFEGFGEVGAQISTTKSPYQDGSTHTGTTLNERYPRIEFIMVANSFESLSNLRKHASRVFNPKIKGQFKLEYGANHYVLDVIPEHVPSFMSEDMVGKTQKASVDLIAPNPYWLSEDTHTQEIVSWIGGMTFPLELPTQFATKGEKILNVVNGGDVETPIKIEISGQATNPKLTVRETGEYLKLKGIISGEDVVVITTDFGNKRVELNGENAFNLLDLPDSTFIQLAVGDNVLEFTTEDSADTADVKISYRNRYLGV